MSILLDKNQFIICFIYLGMPDQYYQVKVNARQIGEAINKFMKGNPTTEIVVVRNTRFDKENEKPETLVIT